VTTLRNRLLRTPQDHPATERELASRYTRQCPQDIAGWAHLASALIQLGLYSEARRALRRLDKLAEQNPYLVSVRWGEYYAARGELKRAETWYRRAVLSAPGALVFLGGVLAKQGRLAEAKVCHRRATKVRADFSLARDEAYLNLGWILRAERRYREALLCLEHAVALDPNYTAAIESRADVQAALKAVAPSDERIHWWTMMKEWGPRPATAHELARHYTQRYADRSAGWIVLADILAGFARYAEAAQALRRAAQTARSEKWREDPGHHFATQSGLLHEQKKDFRRAESCFRRAVALRRSARNLTHLGEVLVLSGRLSAAEPYLRRAVLHSGDQSAAHYQLGLIARARRKYDAALNYFDEAIRQSRVYPLARQARRDVRRAMKVARSTLASPRLR
jgi:tetratricopeptide (TPR) repeat protein